MDIFDISNFFITLISNIWDGLCSFLLLFIIIPMKILDYLIIFGSYILTLLIILFDIIDFCILNIWLLGVIFIATICIQTYLQHANSPHERLILFAKNLFHSFIWIVHSSFWLFRQLYEFSLKIISKLIEHIPFIQ